MKHFHSQEKRLWDKYRLLQQASPFQFGPYYSYQLRSTPRHVLFTMSRYKFAAKVFGGGKTILELGCNEGMGSYFLSEFARGVTGVDFDEGAISWAQSNLASKKLQFKQDDFLDKRYGSFDGVVSYDVIEHIYNKNEKRFFKTLVKNVKRDGLCIVGTPNKLAEKFSNRKIQGAHVHTYSPPDFSDALRRYFHHVFLFGMNDEVIHTGFLPMAHYLIAVCCSVKKGVIS